MKPRNYDPVNRRLALGGMAAGLACALPAAAGHHRHGARPPHVDYDFVKVRDGLFSRRGAPYRYVGANMWYGAYLASPGPTGDRARLGRELDRLAALGVRNLRILASSELGPLKHSLTPAFHSYDPKTRKLVSNPDLYAGLDYLLSELQRRDMTAVLYLTNFWEWSGGMMTYLSYVKGRFINNGDPAYPWPTFPNRVAEFYETPEAISLFEGTVRELLTRRNGVTGKAYRDDPTIMAWQLCNEPRPTGDHGLLAEFRGVYLNWIKRTARLIHENAPRHLVSLGHEGLMGAVMDEPTYRAAHEHIDYLTAHIWPQNWSWIDVDNIVGTFDAGAAKVAAYIDTHIRIAADVKKPLVFEEFGFPRDEGRFDPGSPTTFKDRFYGMIYDHVQVEFRKDGHLSGSNFWAWGGEGRALHDDHMMLYGETNYVGDPPHEPQGWYSVFDNDDSTCRMIKAHAEFLKTVG